MLKKLFTLMISFFIFGVQAQNNLLFKTFASNCQSASLQNFSPVFDSNGNIYFFYSFWDSLNFQAPNGNHLIQTGPMLTYNSDVLVLKMDLNGNIIFKGSIGGTGTKHDGVVSYAINQNNEILIAMLSYDSIIDIDPSANTNLISNPMQFGSYGQVLLRYDSNFNLLNSFTQFSAFISFITSTQNNWLTHSIVNPGETLDVDFGIGSQMVSNTLGTNMQMKVIALYNSMGVYQSDFRFQQGNSALGVQLRTTEMYSNANGETFIVGNCADSAVVNTIGGTVLSLPVVFPQSNIYFMKLNSNLQCEYYKNLSYSANFDVWPEIQADNDGNAYISCSQAFFDIDLDPGLGIVKAGTVNSGLPFAECGISKYDSFGNYINHIYFNKMFTSNYQLGNFDIKDNLILFSCFTKAGVSCSVDGAGNSNVYPGYGVDGIPISILMDSALNVLTYFNPDTIPMMDTLVMNFGGKVTPNGILWSIHRPYWLDLDFDEGLDTIPKNSIAFIGLNGGLFAGLNSIDGKIYFDMDLNSIISANDIPGSFKFLKTNSNTHYSFSNIHGDYRFYLSSGTFNYAPVANVPIYCSLNPASHTTIFSGTGLADNNKNFEYIPTPNVHDLQVFHTTNSNHRPGLTASYRVFVKNIGSSSSNYTLKLIIDPAMNSISTIPPFSQQFGDTLVWTSQSLLPFNEDLFQINSIIDSTTSVGDTLVICSIVQNSPEMTPSDNSFCDFVIATASCDPNYKEVNWGNSISTADMGSLPWFYYTIHFQNTGNDTAFNIHVIDTIRQHFDLGSFEILHASHPCQPVYLGNSILDFKFQNILLPDSTTNEPLSHGQVSYRIKPSQNWPAGTVLQNGAAIYFDFNLPVITAPMLTTVVAPVGLSEFSTHSNDVLAYPNPGTGVFRIQSKNEVEKVVVYNLMGQNVATAEITGKEKTFDLDLRHLENGIYLANVFNNGKLNVVKLVVQH